MTPEETENRVRNGPNWARVVVNCGVCGERVRGTQRDLRYRLERTAHGVLYCSLKCLRARQVRPCAVPSCARTSRSSIGYCELHYHRYKRTGDPMLKTRHRGIDDGALVNPPVTPELSPAQIAILVELADGQARSVGLLCDLTAYSEATIYQSVKRLRRKYGADAIEIVQRKPLRFRLKDKISLA